MKARATLSLILMITLCLLAACDVQESPAATPRSASGGMTAVPAPQELAPAPGTAGGASLPTDAAPVFPTPTPEPPPDAQRMLEVLHAGPVTNLDPGYTRSPDDLRITRLIFDGLVQFKPGSQEIEPALAERWTVSEDGKSWTFRLRERVQFHDGTPFNADAVLFSYQRLIDEGNPYYRVGGASSPFERLLGGEIRAMRKLDAHTVRFDLWQPFAPFLTYLAAAQAGIVSPSAIGRWHSDFAQNPVGTGPYRMQAITPGAAVTVTASIGFWGKPPQLSAIVFRRIGDADQRLTALQEGQGGALVGASPAQLAALAKDRRFTLLRTPGANLSWLLLNPERAPELADVRVRRAILHAIDIQNIVDNAWGSAGERAINPFPQSMPCWNRLVRPYDYDPERSRTLLREAGYSDGLTLTLDYSATPRPYMPDPSAVAAAVAGNLAAVGISVTLQQRQWDELTKLADRRQLAFHLIGWYDMPEPDLFMRQMLLETEYARGDFGPTMVELADQAAHSYDQGLRCARYGQMQQIFHDTAERVPLAHAQYVDAVAANIKGYLLDPDGVQNLREVSLIRR